MKRLFVLLKDPYGIYSNPEHFSEENFEDYIVNSPVFKRLDFNWYDELYTERLEGNELNLVINKLNIVYPDLLHFNDEGKLVLQVSTELKNSLFIKNKNKLEAQLEKFKSMSSTEEGFLNFVTSFNRTQDEIFENEENYMGFFEDDSLGLSGFVAYNSEADFEYEVLGIYAYHV